MRTVRYVVECVLADRHELTEQSLEQLWRDEFSSEEHQTDMDLTPDQLFFRRHYQSWARFQRGLDNVPSFSQWGRDLLQVTLAHQVRLEMRSRVRLPDTRAEEGSVRYQDMTRTLHDFHQVILKARR